MTARADDVLTTVEQLEALPVETMIRDHMGEPHVRYVPYRGAGRWQEVGMDYTRTSSEMVSQIGGGFTVLHVPGEQEPGCGGCQNLGAHSPACRTQPGAYWYRVAQQADALGDLIGPNDMELANDAWDIAHFARIRRDNERYE